MCPDWTRCRNARRDEQLLRKVHPSDDGYSDQQERHERVPWRVVRNQPQQRLRRRAPPAGHVHEGAVPEPQRVRRLGRRPGLYIPKVYNGRNRTFFFVSWEGLRSVAYTTQPVHVPTEAMRNGDFRGLVDSQGRQITLYDPVDHRPGTLAAAAADVSTALRI